MNSPILRQARRTTTRVATSAALALALTFGTSGAAGAQVGAPLPQQLPEQPPADAPTAAAARATVEGCLVAEKDVPGREPNIAERAGILEDYILTSTRVVKGTAPKPDPSPAGSPSSSSPSSATVAQSPMYKVTGIDDNRLKQLLNQRVQVDGIFVDVDRENAAPQAARSVEDLVEIRGTAIREVAGGVCPAK